MEIDTDDYLTLQNDAWDINRQQAVPVLGYLWTRAHCSTEEMCKYIVHAREWTGYMENINWWEDDT